MTPILKMEKVSATYGPFRALYDVDLEIAQGQAFGLLGQNGAGKSTIARVISGLVPASSGSDQHRWPARPAPQRRADPTSRHPPGARGPWRLLLALGRGEPQGGADGPAAGPAADALLDEIYDRFALLGERRRARAGTLSGGQQRLLALAPAFVAPPRLLIADEPSLGLAPNVLDEIYASLRDLKEAGVDAADQRAADRPGAGPRRPRSGRRSRPDRPHGCSRRGAGRSRGRSQPARAAGGGQLRGAPGGSRRAIMDRCASSDPSPSSTSRASPPTPHDRATSAPSAS